MIYVNSEGVECETEALEKTHLVNALIKNAKDSVRQEDPDKRSTAVANVAALKTEVLSRIK